MSTDSRATGYPDTIFLATIEIASFIFLFISPYLGREFLQLGWIALVFWRVAALGGILYFDNSERTLLLARSVLYGIPFWASSLAFPLRAGQSFDVGRALLGYLALLPLLWALSKLSTHWYPALLGGLTFAYLYQDSTQIPWIGVGALAVGVWPLRHGERAVLDGPGLRVVSFAAGAGWAFCLFLAVVGGPAGLKPLALSLLHWLVLVAAATDLLSRARENDRNREIEREGEAGLPGLREALIWRYSRKTYRRWLPWIVVVVWAPGLVLGVALGLVLLLALPAMIKLAANGVKEGGLQRFVCWQFVFLWGLAELPGYALGWILLSGLTVIYLGAKTTKFKQYTEPYHQELSRLEGALRHLRQEAPEGFAAQVSSQLEPSVDLDSSLSSEAPAGFRQRLLERFRRQQAED
ncbi:MAG: hypothetical protein WC314_01755 [Vulcanimicrobiota bacterium]